MKKSSEADRQEESSSCRFLQSGGRTVQEITKQFDTKGTVIRCVPFGSGHINGTWLVVTNRPHLYILQSVNTEIFRDPAGLMNNILLVTEHLRGKDPDPRHVLRLVKLRDGRDYLLTEHRALWRMYEFVTGGICLDRAECALDFRNSGKAFGDFQRKLADFPANTLSETIPGFHDTPARFAALRKALREDRAGRAGRVRWETDFLLEREEKAGMLQAMLKAGDLPLRVTHNDTKLNNVMLDEKTREPLCILDLDTVMPGLAGIDFGDAIRYGASTADEDEPDPEKVHLDLELYKAYAEGFLEACGDSLTGMERETLPDCARIITLETATRFLTDYLNGDTYFHIDRPDHNLDRTRTQIAMVRDMEKHESEIRSMMREF